MDDLYIVTVATSIDYYMPYLIESCKRNGKELTVLGLNEKWQGFNWRFKIVNNFLNKINDNDIVCFIDGYDVICTRNLNELKNEFIRLKEKNNCRIIISENKTNKNNISYIFMKLVFYLYFDRCNNINLNAGTYIGYVKDLKIILNEIYNYNPIDNADDQILFTKYCKRNSDLYIDINNEIFLTLDNNFGEIDKLVISNNKIIYNNNIPFFIHTPIITFLGNVIKFLGYNENELKNTCVKKINSPYYECKKVETSLKKIKKKIIIKNFQKLPFYLSDNFQIQLLFIIFLLSIIYLLKKLIYNY